MKEKYDFSYLKVKEIYMIYDREDGSKGICKCTTSSFDENGVPLNEGEIRVVPLIPLPKSISPVEYVSEHFDLILQHNRARLDIGNMD